MTQQIELTLREQVLIAQAIDDKIENLAEQVNISTNQEFQDWATRIINSLTEAKKKIIVEE